MVKFNVQCDNCFHKAVCYDKASVINCLNEILTDNLSSSKSKLDVTITCSNFSGLIPSDYKKVQFTDMKGE